MKVLLLAKFLPPCHGGEQRHVWTLATALAAKAHEVVRRTRSALRTLTNDLSSSATNTKVSDDPHLPRSASSRHGFREGFSPDGRH